MALGIPLFIVALLWIVATWAGVRPASTRLNHAWLAMP